MQVSPKGFQLQVRLFCYLRCRSACDKFCSVEEEETFDIGDVSTSSEDNIVPRQHTSDAPSKSLPLNPDPLLNTDWSQAKTSLTFNVNYFFTCKMGVESVCNHCQKLHDNDPSAWNASFPNNRRWITYSSTTMTGMLQGHIKNWHLIEYIEIASNPNRKWPIQVLNVKVAIGLGYTLDELKEIAKMDGKLKKLPPHPTNSTTPDDAASKKQANILPFSLPQLHNHLVDFIVADDQSLNVVKCKEFECLLLFLREDLEDKDIPHHTKIKMDIIQAWKDYFVILKQDLAVCILTFIELILLIVSVNCVLRIQLRMFPSPLIYGLVTFDSPISL
ncbi:hypothetical protein SCLCIDRAFT_105772 [Scleroderma citrinum Foug A]|uniref:Uncharacterized protein n=1 Tax=Scleroderma citrinum Foug A TaxID=1036808 RepID=A0A0C3E6B6_9AGAM|nr:hypothetical protein SCLCIDRAFT_105772 [Scleroderma citrinum Foug A]